jgi:putative aldouronate transport system substrate-binding protein
MWIGDFCATMCVQNYPDFDKGNPTAELVYFDPPKGPQGRSAVSLFAQVGTLYAVSKKAVDAGKGEAIARFLEWANSDEGYFALGFGEPGVNFILKSGAVSYEGIEASKTFNSRETGPQQQLKWFALDGNEAELNLRYPSFKSANGRTIVPMDYYRAANKFSYVDTIPQLAIQPAANQADIDRYISEGLTAFALGQRPLNATEWNRFVAGLKRLKFDDYVAAANAALKAAGFVK